MNSTVAAAADPSRPATAEDVRHVLGQTEDVLVMEILAVQPTYQELSEAALWARGDGDLAAREAKHLSAAALAIASILAEADESDSEER